jgi:hypothetical protein
MLHPKYRIGLSAFVPVASLTSAQLRAPRHLFTSSPPSPTHFFSLSFSLGKNKLRFTDAPHDLNVAISNALKHATLFDVEEIDDDDSPPQPVPHEEDSDDEEGHDTRGIYTYRLTKRVTVPRSKKDGASIQSTV